LIWLLKDVKNIGKEIFMTPQKKKHISHFEGRIIQKYYFDEYNLTLSVQYFKASGRCTNHQFFTEIENIFGTVLARSTEAVAKDSKTKMLQAFLMTTFSSSLFVRQ
jgi:hypothetical protein